MLFDATQLKHTGFRAKKAATFHPMAVVTCRSPEANWLILDPAKNKNAIIKTPTKYFLKALPSWQSNIHLLRLTS